MTDLSLFAWGVTAWAALILAPCWAVARIQCWIYDRKRRN